MQTQGLTAMAPTNLNYSNNSRPFFYYNLLFFLKPSAKISKNNIKYEFLAKKVALSSQIAALTSGFMPKTHHFCTLKSFFLSHSRTGSSYSFRLA